MSHAMQLPRCSRCVFGAPAQHSEPPSYAFALCHAADSVAAVFEAANKTALSEALSGVSVYCTECRCVTWLTQHADLQSGLLHMHADRARWRALHTALDAT